VRLRGAEKVLEGLQPQAPLLLRLCYDVNVIACGIESLRSFCKRQSKYRWWMLLFKLISFHCSWTWQTLASLQKWTKMTMQFCVWII